MGWRLDVRGTHHFRRLVRYHRDPIHNTQLHALNGSSLGPELQTLHPQKERARPVESLSSNLWNHQGFGGWRASRYYGHRKWEALCRQAIWSREIRQTDRTGPEVPANGRTRCEVRHQFESRLEPDWEHGLRGYRSRSPTFQLDAFQSFHSGKTAILFGECRGFQFRYRRPGPVVFQSSDWCRPYNWQSSAD